MLCDAHSRRVPHSLVEIPTIPLKFGIDFVRHTASVDILIRDGGHRLLARLEGFVPENLCASKKCESDSWFAVVWTKMTRSPMPSDISATST